MINLNDIKGRSAITLLENYSGINPYILKLKQEFTENRKKILTENQTKYILENSNKVPLFINRVIGITPYLGESFKNSEELTFTPEKILVEFILADMENSFHVYGKIKQNQSESKMYWLPKTQVTQDIYFEPIDIDVDFSKYNDVLALSGKKLYDHQESGIKFLLSRNGCILADDMGLGKMEFIDNQVFTPNGRQKIGNIKIGDKVIGSNGKPCNVTGVFPQGIKELYRITFNDGYSVLVGAEHLWSVSYNNSGDNRYITLSTEQMLNKDLVLGQIGIGCDDNHQYKFKTYYKQSNGQSKWRIPIVKPIEFENNSTLPIEPYLLGLYLGDGHIKSHKDDLTKYESYLNTLTTKFIPDTYKYSSINDRVSMLQGLMDTDGYCIKSKTGIFVSVGYRTTNEKLVDDVVEIVHSLGGIVKKSTVIGSYKNKEGVKVIRKQYYRLNIKMSEGINPFRNKINSDLYDQPKKYKVGRYITDIKLETTAEAVCIAVDATDKLYVTEHAIVTHNTTQSIIAALESGVENILILCPSSAKINWEREINVFCDDTIIIDGKKWGKAKFTIINFDILKNFHTLDDKKKLKDGEVKILNRDIVNSNFGLVIIDEAHNLKNHESIRGKIMVDVIVNNGIDKVWLLTGTPVANRPMDFFNLLKIIKSPIADNWRHFAVRYCEGRQFFKVIGGLRRQIWLTDGASNLEELSIKTKNIIIRRLKTEVLDMPDKVVTPMYHKLSDKNMLKYNELWDDYLLKREKELKTTDNLQKELVELILLRKFIAMEAIPHTIEIVENAIAMGRKVIVFTSFSDELEAINQHFGKLSVKHNGLMNSVNKQKSVDSFQTNPKIKVFVGNIKSAGVAITLTEATVVIFNSFDWVSGNNEQAEDRAFRIGQKNDVNVYYQLFDVPISVKMWETLKRKKDIINTILNGKSEEEQMILLIDEITNKEI